MDAMMWSLMDIIFLGVGGYLIYAWYLMQTTGEIKKNLLMDEKVELRRCKDLEGYKRFIGPKMLIFGVICLLHGALGLVNTYVVLLPSAVYIANMVIFLIALVWYAMQTKKGLRLFW